VEVGPYRGGVAEDCEPAYDLQDCDYQVIQASRGCIRHCSFCGTWRIEPKAMFRRSVVDSIVKPKVVFYDNNFLANPHVASILGEVADFRLPDGRRVLCECQCGFDTRLITPELAKALKRARFRNVRISWDGRYEEWPVVNAAVDALEEAGYPRRDTAAGALSLHADQNRRPAFGND